MIRKSSFRNLVVLFMAIGLFATFIGCKDENDGGPLKEDVAVMKANLQKQIDALKEQVNGLNPGTGTPVDLSGYVQKSVYEAFVSDVQGKLDAAATKEELNSLKGQLADDGKIGKITTALKFLTEGDMIAKLKEIKDNVGLDAIKEFNQAIKENQNLIKTLSSLVKDYEVNPDGTVKQSLVAKFTQLEKKLGVFILNGRLTGLVFKPEFVDGTGSLPVVYFTKLDTKTTCAKEITGPAYLQYYVNPSTVSMSDIGSVKVVYNSPKFRKEKPLSFEAEKVGIENGILTVKLSVSDLKKLNYSETSGAYENNKLDQIMLQVGVNAGEDENGQPISSFVSSDWVKVKYETLESNILVNKYNDPSDPEKGYKAQAEYIVKNTLQDAKNIDVNDNTQNQTVIDVTVGEELDLNKAVRTVFSDWRTLKNSDYGLEFSFDLKDENGKDIKYELGANNKTDQQQFIGLKNNNTVAYTRVYTEGTNNAAVGRTPIVHVMLKKGDCLIKEGWVKLNIVPKVKPTEERVFNYGDIYANCDDPQEIWRVGTKQMNIDYYHHYDISKDSFHKSYTFDGLNGEGDGFVSQVQDPNDSESFNLVWKINNVDAWKGLDKKASKEISKSFTYTSGARVIKVTFKATIHRDRIKFETLPAFFDAAGKYTTLNVSVPSKDDTNPLNCKYEPYLSNSFRNIKSGSDIVLDKTLFLDGKPKNYYDLYTYEYTFVPVKEQTQPKDIAVSLANIGVSSLDNATIARLAKIKVSVDGTGKVLEAQEAGAAKQEIVKIVGDKILYQDNDLAKFLLNVAPEFMRARVQITAKNPCTKDIDVVVEGLADVNKFDVHFLRPVNLKGRSTKGFVDGVTFGKKGSWIDMLDVANLSDWRNYKKHTTDYDFAKAGNENFYDYYKVQSITIDKNAIKYVGSNGKEISVPGSIDVDQTPNSESFTYNKDENDPSTSVTEVFKFGRLTYKNNGTNLNEDVTLKVPVTVTYKWGVTTTIVDVPVKATSTTAKRK